MRVILLVAAMIGCNQTDGEPIPDPVAEPREESTVEPAHAGSDLRCRLVVSGSGPYGVAIEVTNTSAEAITLHFFHPLMFSLQAEADGQPIVVRVPASSLPAEPRELRVDAGATELVPTPVRLRFVTEDEPMSDDPFSYELVHAPAVVSLRASRAFDDTIVCTGTLTP